ncbi:MAG: HEAT repeat domain-containing protein [Polyangia bacterium]
MLTGRLPFEEETLGKMLRAHIEEPPPPLRERLPQLKVAESLEALVRRLLGKTRDERFASMAEVAAALEGEADRILVQRGQKAVLSRQLLGSLRLRIFGRLLPLWAVAASLMVLLGGAAALVYVLLLKPPLSPEELEAIRARALAVLQGDTAATATTELRQHAVRSLGQTRDVRLRPDLEKLLLDPRPEVQAEAATALGVLGDRQAAPALVRALGSEKAPPLRTALAGALLSLGDSAGATELSQLVQAKDDRVRLTAARLLCDSGQAAAQPPVRALLARPELPPSLAVELLACLVRLGDEASLRALRSRMTTPGPRDVQLLAAGRLAQLGDSDGRAYLLRLALARGPDQLTAAWLLSDPSEPRLAEVFRAALDNRNAPEPQRVLGAEGLGQAGEIVEVRRLDRYLGATVAPPLRQAAAAAILVLARGGDANLLRDQGLAWALGAAGDASAETRQAAAVVLGENASEQAVALLGKLLRDGNVEVRRAAARALGRRSEGAVVALLAQALDDADAGVRAEALRSLAAVFGRLGARSSSLVTPLLLGRLDELVAKGSETEKVLAASALLRLGNEAMRAELRRLGASSDPAVRKLVLEALEGDREHLAGALADADAGVRLLAARLLAGLGDKRAVPVLQEALGRGGPDGLLAYVLLRRLGVEAPVPGDLEQLLGSGKKAQRLAAVAALRWAAPEAAGPLLARAARDLDAEVRQKVAEVTGELLLAQKPPKDPTLLAVLRLLGGDADTAVWTRARALLARVLGAAPLVGELALGSPEPPPAEPRRGAAKPQAETAEPAAGAGEPEPPPAQSGQLIVEGPAGVQFLYKRAWHTVPATLELPFGEYDIDTLAGEHEVVVQAGAETRLNIEESTEEKALRAGVAAAKKGGLAGTARSRAIGQLERARSGCLKGSFRDAPPCQAIILQASYYVGKLREEEGAEGQAMDAFQQVAAVADRVKGMGELKSGAESAIARLRPRLGHVVEKASVGGRCVAHEYWVTPGKTAYQSVLQKREITVSVSAGRTASLNFCEGSP